MKASFLNKKNPKEEKAKKEKKIEPQVIRLAVKSEREAKWTTNSNSIPFDSKSSYHCDEYGHVPWRLASTSSSPTRIGHLSV